MLMMEYTTIQRNLGEHKKVVRSIRRKRNKRSISDIIDFLEISEDEYQSVIAALDSHPDWDDEKIAEEIDWTD